MLLLYFIFAIQKFLQILWKIFLIPEFRANKYKKQMCYKENKSLFFLSLWEMARFFLQKFVIFNMITDSFLIEKWGALERARRNVWINLPNLDCQDSIRFNIYQVANEESFGKSFSFPFSAKYFDRNFKCLV